MPSGSMQFDYRILLLLFLNIPKRCPFILHPNSWLLSAKKTFPSMASLRSVFYQIGFETRVFIQNQENKYFCTFESYSKKVLSFNTEIWSRNRIDASFYSFNARIFSDHELFTIHQLIWIHCVVHTTYSMRHIAHVA